MIKEKRHVLKLFSKSVAEGTLSYSQPYFFMFI